MDVRKGTVVAGQAQPVGTDRSGESGNCHAEEDPPGAVDREPPSSLGRSPAACRIAVAAPAFSSDSTRPGARTATKTAPAINTAAPARSARLNPWTNASFAFATRLSEPRRFPIAWAAASDPRAWSASDGGRAELCSATLERYALLRTLPRIAIPERAAQLARHVVDRRRDALLLTRQRGDDGRRGRRPGQGHSGAERNDAYEEVPVGRAAVEGGEDDEPGGHQSKADRTGDANAHPPGDLRRKARERNHDGGHREERRRGLQR